MKNRILFTLFIAMHFFSSCTIDKAILTSPDGTIQFELKSVDNQLNYLIKAGDKEVILLSELHLNVDDLSLTETASIELLENYQIDELYSWYGVHNTAMNKANGIRIHLKNKTANKTFLLEMRVSNDGAAYRFIVPETGKPQVPDESSNFQIPAGSTVWYHGLRGHYESVHSKKTIDELEAGEWAAPPVTIQLPENGGYISITEAALTNYAGMALQADGKSGLTVKLGHLHPASYPYTLRYGDDEAERLSHAAAISGEIKTPWRVVLIAPDLNTLVNSDLVANLCPAPDNSIFPDGIKTSWIKPGRAVWRYLDGGGKTDLPTMKEFSKLAGEMGFEHHILEGFWRNWSDEEITELVTYADQQKVGIWVWAHSKDLHGKENQEAFFSRCQRLGITGVKIDFLDHEAKEVIDLYEQLLNGAAHHQLSVNFHGANKPTGMNRTWPNEITREGVKGMESRSVIDRATHNVTVPFTRMVVGNADYTPMHFGERRGNTTWANQIASTIIFNSELLTFAASPQNIMANPALELIKQIPSVWDETRVLEVSEIGKIAVFARRSSETWFLAGMNGSETKNLKIPLTFLGNENYKASVVMDQIDNPASVVITEESHSSKDHINLDLQPGGGFVYRFTK